MGGKTKKIEIVNKKGKVTDITIKHKKKKKVLLPPLPWPKGVSGRVRGKGTYSIGDIASAVAKPFTDTTASQGFVNKAARYAGSKLGDLVPIPGAGEALGNAASWLARIAGFGDYTLRRNSFMTDYAATVPQFKDNGGLTFAHREYIMDITTSVAFNNQGFLINAGNPILFPWLSRLAANYEEFEFLGLVFEFRTTSATAVGSTNTGLGTLIMATDYDCIDSNYGSKQAMEIADFATSSAPCYNQIHPVECDPRRNVMRKLFVQNATTLAGYPDDPRFSVLGNFQIATSGVQAPSVAGELWVSYHVHLSKPQLSSVSTIQSQPFAHMQYNTVNAASVVPVSQSYYPNNGGITINNFVGYSDVVCSNVLGLGTYLAVFRAADISATGSIVYFPTTIATPSGGTTIATTVQHVTGATGLALGLGNNSIGINESGALSRPGVVCFVIFTFSALTQSIRIFGATDNANTIQNDIYVAPYALSNLSKPLSEKAQMKEKIAELYQMVSAMSSLNPPETTVNVRDSSKSDVGELDTTCISLTRQTRLVQHRPACISIPPPEELTPTGVDRYVEVVRSEPLSKDTSQLRRQ